MKYPRKPRLETTPMVEVDIEKAERNSGANSPNPMRAGPKLMAVAAKPAAESVRNPVMTLPSLYFVLFQAMPCRPLLFRGRRAAGSEGLGGTAGRARHFTARGRVPPRPGPRHLMRFPSDRRRGKTTLKG